MYSILLFFLYKFFSKCQKQSQPQLLKNNLKLLKNINHLLQHKKKEVCLKKLAFPFLKNKNLAKEYNVSKGMICDTLKAKEYWLTVDLNLHQAGLKYEKKVLFPLIEEALTIWIENALQTGLVLTDNQLRP